MPKTMTLNVKEYQLIRDLLRTELKKAKASYDRMEAKVKAGGKHASWLRAPEERLLLVTKLYDEAMKPVMVERTNLLSGKTFMEAEDTPNYCSPASEAYHSM